MARLDAVIRRRSRGVAVWGSHWPCLVLRLAEQLCTAGNGEYGASKVDQVAADLVGSSDAVAVARAIAVHPSLAIRIASVDQFAGCTVVDLQVVDDLMAPASSL